MRHSHYLGAITTPQEICDFKFKPDFFQALRVSLDQDTGPVQLLLQEEGVGSSLAVQSAALDEHSVALRKKRRLRMLSRMHKSCHFHATELFAKRATLSVVSEIGFPASEPIFRR